MAGEAERNTGETIRGAEVANMRYFTIREPVGPVALLSPWVGAGLTSLTFVYMRDGHLHTAQRHSPLD
jgi:acyl-CoA reductase-like NAD-dependent aldehyde dehydrogenase